MDAPATRTGLFAALLTLALLAILALARVGFVADAHVSCRNLGVDDLYYARSADHIAEGRWLGPWNWRTHIKSPGFPAWLALLRIAGIPARLGQELLFIGAVFALFAGLRRVGLARPPALVVAAALLFHPIMTWGNYSFLVRENIYPAQILLIAAILLHALASATWVARLGQGLALALATTFAWFSREESLWLVPVLVLGLAPAMGLEWRRRGAGRALALLALTALPTIAAVLGTGRAIDAINERYYGAPIRVTFADPDFRAAMGAVMRAEPEPVGAYHAVSAATLERLMSWSPTLAQARGSITSASFRSPYMVNSAGDRISNFLCFVLVTAAESEGKARSLGEAKAWYRAVADEINRELDRAPETYGARRDSVMPPLRTRDLEPAMKEFGGLTVEMADLGFAHQSPVPTLPYGDCGADDEALLRRVCRLPERPSLSRWSWRTRLLFAILDGWRLVLPWASSLAGVLLLGRLVAFRKLRFSPATWAGFILLAIGLGRAALVALINTVYSPHDTMYLGPGFLLFAAGVLVIIADGARHIPFPRFLAHPLVGLLVAGAGLFALGSVAVETARLPSRFLAPAEVAAVAPEGPRDGVEVHGCDIELRAGTLYLRGSSNFASLHLWPWSRRPLENGSFELRGRFLTPGHPQRFELNFGVVDAKTGETAATRHPIDVGPSGDFSVSIPVTAAQVTLANLNIPWKPGTMLELQRLSLVPNQSTK